MRKYVKRRLLLFKVKPFFIVFFLIFLVRVAYLFLYPRLWWDSYIYLGQAKYIFSLGKEGLWEVFRPPLFSLILGFFNKVVSLVIPLDLVGWGKFLDLVFSLAALYFFYLIFKKLYPEKHALLATLIFGLTPLFLKFTGLILTEPLAIFLGLVAFYLILENKYLGGGFFLALSFLAKFPQGILFFVVFLLLLFSKETSKFKKLSNLFLGFFLVLFPYLLLNFYFFKDPFLPFKTATEIITTYLWYYPQGSFYYFTHFFLKNPFYLFYFPALVFYFKKNKFPQRLFYFAGLFILLYFLYVPRKETRYLVLALPYFCFTFVPFLFYLRDRLDVFLSKKRLEFIFYTLLTFWLVYLFFFTGAVALFYYLFLAIVFFLITLLGLIFYLRKKIFKQPLSKIRKIFYCFILGLLFLVPFLISGIFFYYSPEESFFRLYTPYFSNLTGPILSSNPLPLAYGDQEIILLSDIAKAEEIYEREKKRAKYIILSDCDLPCPLEESCLKKKEAFFQKVKKENQLIFERKYYYPFKEKYCWAYLFKTI